MLDFDNRQKFKFITLSFRKNIIFFSCLIAGKTPEHHWSKSALVKLYLTDERVVKRNSNEFLRFENVLLAARECHISFYLIQLSADHSNQLKCKITACWCNHSNLFIELLQQFAYTTDAILGTLQNAPLILIMLMMPNTNFSTFRRKKRQRWSAMFGLQFTSDAFLRICMFVCYLPVNLL